jgi:flagellar motility protein MotE (MotC chaperone)
MKLLQRISEDVKAGWVKVRYGTARVATRALEETELVRLRLQLRKCDERLRELHREVGERAVALHERGEKVERVLVDTELLRLIDQLSSVKAERAKLLAEMDDVRSSP